MQLKLFSNIVEFWNAYVDIKLLWISRSGSYTTADFKGFLYLLNCANCDV